LLRSHDEHEAIQALASAKGWQASQPRMLVAQALKGHFPKGVRAFGLRRARYRGLRKTRVRHVATATAINVGRSPAGSTD
jgi:hypothetical protein